VEGVGDTVVFFLKGYEWVHVFPSAEIEFFQKDPCLLSDRLQDEIPPIVTAKIYWRKARITSLLLATDALAAYLVKIEKEERREIFTLLHRGTVSRIRKTLAEEMKNMRIKRDDLSFVWLELKMDTSLRRREGHEQ